MGGYGLVDTGAGSDAVIGGIGPSMAPGDTGVKVYVRVDDLDVFLGRAVELGGVRLVEPTKLPGEYGTFAIFADLDGNPVGLWA
jgi:predicted enzyme related to lactoylglutathione lyase